jgi:tetratricopeptide (TPR) repeat protein
MFRFGAFSLFGIIVLTFASLGNPPEDANFNKALAVQTAMVRASTLLSEMKSAQAVEALEEQLPNVNNNPQYLSQLRDCYRAYIRDLHIAGRPELAKRYLDRLCILDPSAKADPTLKAAVETPPHKFEQEPAKQSLLKFPEWKMPNLNPFAKKEEPKSPTPIQPSAIRAASAESITEDPFERKNQREMPSDRNPTQARELVTRGTAEFKQARYAEAKVCFEQAYAADRSAMESCRDSWAYCILAGVAKTMEQPGAIPAKVPEMQKQIEAAIEMAPTKMMKVGQELRQNLEQRVKQQTAAPSPVAAKVKHMGANKEGWQVAESAHFRIFHRQNNEYAERIAQVAETTRTTMYRKWFETDGVEWTPICELIVHPNAAGYTQMTGVPSNSPGHSRIESEPTGRVTARRLDVRMDITGMTDTVLPHEATHVVLAGMFDAHHVPRWADEGIAVLSEPEVKIDQHRRNLLKCHKDGLLFGLKELMELKDYPNPRRVGAFYAQSVVLVEFLTNKHGPKFFTDFVKDGLRHGYEKALQQHYRMTFAELDQAWQQQVIANTERFASK